MYLVESKSEYRVELWDEEDENKLYKINDILPLKNLGNRERTPLISMRR